MRCPICNVDSNFIFEETVLNKYRIKYYQCDNCSCIHTETPYWLNESYADSITAIDTGIMSRNIQMAIETNYIIQILLNKSMQFVDFAGGYGIFTRLMRDMGYDFYWYDKFSPNLMARGYEWDDSSKEKVGLVTAFEAFEHFDEPIMEINRMLEMSDSILFSTLLYDQGEGISIPPTDWWYYVLETGQHIIFYSEKTLCYLAKKYDMHYIKLSPELHLFTKKKVTRYIKCALNFRVSIVKRLLWRRSLRFGKQQEDMSEQKRIYKKLDEDK